MEEICTSTEETLRAGRRMATRLSCGDVVSLEGDLGTGKTHFVKGLADGLGISGPVSSPTFTVIHEYPGPFFSLYHADFYRLESATEVPALGLEDCFASGITVIEWGDRFPEVLPANAKRVRFHILPDASRRLEFSGGGN